MTWALAPEANPAHSAATPAPRPAWLLRLKHLFGVDRAIAYTVLARVIQILGSTGTVLLILRFLSPIEQGYYYTLLSLVSLQVVFGTQPVALPDEQLEGLRAGMNGQLRAEPHPYLAVGRPIRIARGPLRGMEGFLVRNKGVFRAVLSLELIMRSVAVEVDVSEIEPVLQVKR